MRRIGRRDFAKAAAAVAASAPMLASAGLAIESMAQTPAPPSAPLGAQASAAQPTERLSLTAEQQAKLGEAIERRNAQLALLHAPPIPYDLEPAFAFRVRVAPRPGRKP